MNATYVTHRFKVGDKVYVEDIAKDPDRRLVSDTGHITQIAEDGLIEVKPDNWSGGAFWVTPGQVEKI